MSPANGSRRPLSDGERCVLAEVQRYFGAHNAEADVFFSEQNEAVIFAKDASGEQQVCVVLTNLAKWLADGTIPSVDALRDWLGVPAKPSPWWRRLTRRWSGRER